MQIWGPGLPGSPGYVYAAAALASVTLFRLCLHDNMTTTERIYFKVLSRPTLVLNISLLWRISSSVALRL